MQAVVGYTGQAAYARFVSAVTDALCSGLTPEEIAAAAGIETSLVRIVGLNAGWPANPESLRAQRHLLLMDLQRDRAGTHAEQQHLHAS